MSVGVKKTMKKIVQNMVSSPIRIATVYLYTTHLLSPPMMEISRAGAGLLQGLGHLLSETTRLTFETFVESKIDTWYLYKGVRSYMQWRLAQALFVLGVCP